MMSTLRKNRLEGDGHEELIYNHIGAKVKRDHVSNVGNNQLYAVKIKVVNILGCHCGKRTEEGLLV